MGVSFHRNAHLIRVGGQWWPSDDLDRWAAATRIRIDGNWDQTTGYTTMSRDFPGSINWTGQIIFVVIALILIVGFVAVMPSSR